MQYGQGQGHPLSFLVTLSSFATAATGIKQVVDRKTSGLETTICQAP